MPCFHPIPAVKIPAGRNPDGTTKTRLQLHPKDHQPTHWLKCGKCLGCRDAHAAMWALRLRHESRFRWPNTFLTLTYDDDHLPDGLQKPDLQKFWKRLRHHVNDKLTYYACGEYGDRTKRPHYHAAAFGLPRFGDEKIYDTTNQHSPKLTALWGMGQVTLSDLTPERIRYVTGYVLKKAGYRRQVYCDPDGVELEKPFQLMSKGLGSIWFDHYHEQFQHGYARVATTGDAKMGIPRYYREKIKTLANAKHPQHGALQEEIQKAIDAKRASLPDPDPARDRAAETIREQQIKQARQRRAL